MKASREKELAEGCEKGPALQEPAPADNEVDVSLLEESLARTPWERMQANDDALRFADLLRTAMETRNAEP